MERLDKDAQVEWADAFARGIAAFAQEDGISYDGVSAHYWLSGLAGEMLAKTWGVPLSIRFHTLATLKNDALPGDTRRESDAYGLRESLRSRGRRTRFWHHRPPRRARFGEISGASGMSTSSPAVWTWSASGPIRRARRARGWAFGKPDCAYVLSVGRIERVKGLDRLVEAFALTRRDRPGLDARLAALRR